MTRLAICPQQHVWSPATIERGESDLSCPICGEAGEPTTAVAPGTKIESESILPEAVPPLIPASTIILAQGENARDKTAFDQVEPEIPGYEIVGELGRGGMGVVFLARHQTLKRLVALKMIRGDVNADADALARFRREAEAVARLQHHGIVQIHDVGTHHGSPYLALEYVDGENLAERLRGTTMPPRLVAALIESIARTVHYAHQHGIVHRDLTPRNILLARSTSSLGIRLTDADTATSEPKITDFGLAKELDCDVQQTQSGVIMGTPSYMSPEQAKGISHEIGPATDVHALGTVMYEALTGRPPFLAASQFETLLQVIEREPVPPTRLQPSVPRDLETICLKCLEKEPRKRFASAEELAADLRRFLDNEPIHARAVSVIERSWKLSRRHPAAAALLAVSILAAAALIIGGATYNVWLRRERDRAEQNVELAMDAIDRMLTEVGEVQLAVEPRMEKKRQALLAGALSLYQQILSQKELDPRIRRETAQAHRRMADVFRLLGEHEKAIDAYSEARGLLEQLLSESSADVANRRQLANCDNMLGETLRAVGRFDEAEAAYSRAQASYETLIVEQPGVASIRQELASSLYNRGILLKQTERPDQAQTEFERAIALLTELDSDASRTPELRQHLARSYLNLGTIIPANDRFDDAKRAYDGSIDILGGLAKELPDKPDYLHELSVAHNNMGNLLLRTERASDARLAYERARKGFESLARDFPKVPVYRQELANSFNSTGSACSREKDLPGAVKAWTEAAALLEGLVADFPDLVTYRSDLGMVLSNLGVAFHSQEQFPQARAQLEKAVDHLKHALATNPEQEPVRQMLRNTYQNLAEVLLAMHEPSAAALAARSLYEVVPADSHADYVAACYLARCARDAGKDSSNTQAEQKSQVPSYADEALSMLRRAVERGFNDAAQFEKDFEGAFQSLSARPEFQELAVKIRKPAPAP